MVFLFQSNYRVLVDALRRDKNRGRKETKPDMTAQRSFFREPPYRNPSNHSRPSSLIQNQKFHPDLAGQLGDPARVLLQNSSPITDKI
jgi:hypothetical protein